MLPLPAGRLHRREGHAALPDHGQADDQAMVERKR